MRIESVLNFLAYACAVGALTGVFQHVHGFFVSAFAVLLLLAIYRDQKVPFTTPRWLVNALSMALVFPVLLRLQPAYMIEPLLEASLVLLGLKLLETKNAKDHLQIYLLSLLLLVCSGLLSTSALFLVQFILLSALLTTSLMVLSHRSQQEELALSFEHFRKVLKSSLLICAISLPLTALFFVIFPRTPFPVTQLPGYEPEARSGFSDRVSLGEVATIQLDRSVIFRAVMDPVHDDSLYWRGIVLDEFTGSTWQRSSAVQQEQPAAPRGKAIPQRIYLEPYGGLHLFALDKPVSVRGENLKKLPGLTFSLEGMSPKKMQYTAKSVLSELLPEILPQDHRYLQLPGDPDSRIQRLVDRVLHDSSSAHERVERLLHFFLDDQFNYTLEELPVSKTPLEDFLLKTREGNCEYFASALAVMLRMAGIPSRIVGGYRGGIYNGAAGYYLVAQNHAHVWVEAHMPSQGWLRLDPTPPLPLEMQNRPEFFLSRQWRLPLDTFHFHWTRFVINYDLSHQVALTRMAKKILANPPLPWEGKIRHMLAFGGGVVLVFLFFSWMAILVNRPTMEKRLVARFVKRLASHGYERTPQEGLEEFVNRIQEKDLRETSKAIAEELERTVYKDQELSKDQIRRLKQRIGRL